MSRYLIALMLPVLLALACAAHAADKTPLIDKIPVDNDLKAANNATAAQFPAQQEAMLQDLNAYLKGKYQVVDKRFYAFQLKGFLIKDEINDFIVDKLKGESVSDDVTPEYSSVTIWKAGNEYFAFVQAGALPDGNGLYGYFELKKD